MKLAISTLGCTDLGLEKIVSEYKEIGIGAIEVRGIGGITDNGKIPCFFPENEKDTKKLFETNGVFIICLDTGASFDTPENARKGIDDGKAAIEICRRFGIPYIRVFGNALPEGDEKAREKTAELISGSIGELCAYVCGTGIKVLLETHGNICTVENIRPIIERIGTNPNFGLIWDVAHSDRYYGDDFEPFYEYIKPYICHIHFKDHFRLPNHENRLTDIGEGEIPLSKIVGLLKRDGYDGYISFEHEKKWHPELSEHKAAFAKFVTYMKQFE